MKLKENKIKILLFGCLFTNNLFFIQYVNKINSSKSCLINSKMKLEKSQDWNIEVGNAWKRYGDKIQKTQILKVDNCEAGSVIHEIDTYHAENDLFLYTLIVQTIQLRPYYDEGHDWKWWIDSIRFNSLSNDVNNCLLRDYQPKTRSPEAEISYITDLSGEIISSASADISAGISCSFTTKENCPTIKDDGNMAKNTGSILFFFPENSANKQYLTGRVVQCCSHIYRVRKNKNSSTTKVELHFDKNEILLWQNRNDWNWFASWYTKYPEHQKEPKRFEFETPKYILTNK